MPVILKCAPFSWPENFIYDHGAHMPPVGPAVKQRVDLAPCIGSPWLWFDPILGWNRVLQGGHLNRAANEKAPQMRGFELDLIDFPRL